MDEPVVSFSDDQLVKLLWFLEWQRDAGYTIDDVIEGITNGSLLKSPVSS